MARTYIPQRLDGNVWEVVTGEGEWKHGRSFPRLRDARRYARRQGAIEPIDVVDGFTCNNGLLEVQGKKSA